MDEKFKLLFLFLTAKKETKQENHFFVIAQKYRPNHTGGRYKYRHITINNDNILIYMRQKHKSVAEHEKIVCEYGIYSKEILWNTIIKDDPDVIILDLEDDQEFVLTMYLQDIYKDRPKFLQKIVNIIYDPDVASLLTGDKQNKNIIISERLVAKYMTQIAFSSYFADIFAELTSPYGSEFYVLNRRKYPDIFDMNYSELRANLMFSGMVYIGAFDSDDNFVFKTYKTQTKTTR